MISRIDRATCFARIWWKSRAESGKSQEFMAMGLGVSKKTIQNWERGISAPDLFQASEWFRLLGMNPLRYFLAFLYPGLGNMDEAASDDQVIEETLIQLIRDASSLEKKELLFLISGDHGGSWHSLLQLFTAYCQTPLSDRVTAARIISENYAMAVDTGKLVCPRDALPNVELLDYAIDKGKDAVRKSNRGYVTMDRAFSVEGCEMDHLPEECSDAMDLCCCAFRKTIK